MTESLTARSRRPSARCLLLLGAALATLAAPAAQGQLGTMGKSPGGTPEQQPTGNQPVTFLADRVNYDRVNGIVTAEGHVQAWQGDHYLSADRVTFDRNTNVAAATGHVVIVEPDGQIIFGDYAEVSQGMKNGIISGMRSLLANGGKLAANGARRTEGKLNELSRAVYSSCNVCALFPDRPPEWQIRADHMTQDLEHKRIEYSDAWLDLFGFPVLYLPYMSNSDPSVKRQSGLLSPSFGASSSHLGAFFSWPYYLVLDDQSDLTLTPLVSGKQGGQLQAEYRRDFNAGVVHVTGAIASDEGQTEGYLYSSALFNWNDTWRYGANVNVATSAQYLRDYQISGYGTNYLGSNIYIEGFGVGAYSRLDVSGYQGINSTVTQSTLPYVLPRYTYDYVSDPDILGGRISFNTQDFNVLRQQGTNTQRLAGRLDWDRSFSGYFGDQWELTADVRAAAYNATVLNAQPNYGTVSNSTTQHAQPQVALKLNWPFIRDAGSLGTQILEPIVQLIAAPQAGFSQRDELPNEDSLDYEFSDTTLFSLNRFGGYDRFDGGLRANFALHGNWTFAGGQSLDGLIGASAIEHQTADFYPLLKFGTGFDEGSHLSDVVGRLGFVPNKWVDFTIRGRVDHQTGDLRYGEGTMGFGLPIFHMNFGYLYDSRNPYLLYVANPYLPSSFAPGAIAAGVFTPRNEISAGASTHYGHFTLNGNALRNLETGSMDGASGEAKYEDECTIFDFLLARRYTSILGDHGETTVLFTITLKTVGQFGFK